MSEELNSLARSVWVCFPPEWRKENPSQNARVRLFCFPPAGTGAWVFHRWARDLAPEIEVVPVEMPGQALRAKEPRPSSIHVLADSCAAALLPLLRQKPFAFFGHSMGAWVAYEVAHRVLAGAGGGGGRGGDEPPRLLKLYASGNRAPQLAAVEEDVDPTRFSGLPEGEFWERFFARYGPVRGLEGAAMRGYVFPILQSDFRALEAYGATGGRLACPLAAIGATADSRYREDQISAWQAATSGDFSERWFPGGHWLIREGPEALLAFLSVDLVAVAGLR